MSQRIPISVVMLLLIGWSVSTVQGDLVGHWTFDDISGATVPDSVGGDDTGTLTGAVTVVPSLAPVPGGTTSALSFGGARAGETTELSLVDTGNLSPGTGAWSFEAWINPTNVFPADDSGRQALYNDRGAGNNVVQVYLTYNELSTYWRDGAGVDIQFNSLGAGLQAFTWQHVKLERTADTLVTPGSLNFYVNGNPVGTTFLPVPEFNVDTSGGLSPTFGHHVSAGMYWVYNGEMDEVVINGTPPFVPLPGDANSDQVVDDKDASILGKNWLQSGTEIGWAQGDFNADQAVNDKDAAIMAAHWTLGESSAPPSVPEPSTIILLVVGGLIMLVRLHR